MEDEDEPNLKVLLGRMQFDGVVAILCESTQELLDVEKLLISIPAGVVVYNPIEPHFSKHDDMIKFLGNITKEKKGILLTLRDLYKGIQSDHVVLVNHPKGKFNKFGTMSTTKVKFSMDLTECKRTKNEDEKLKIFKQPNEGDELPITSLEEPISIEHIEYAMGKDEKQGVSESPNIPDLFTENILCAGDLNASSFKISDGDMKYQEKPELIDILRQKQSDGVIAILCETVKDIVVVEKMLIETLENGLHRLTVYNPKNPHFSNKKVIFDFVRNLQACVSKGQRKGIFLTLRGLYKGVQSDHAILVNHPDGKIRRFGMKSTSTVGIQNVLTECKRTKNEDEELTVIKKPNEGDESAITSLEEPISNQPIETIEYAMGKAEKQGVSESHNIPDLSTETSVGQYYYYNTTGASQKERHIASVKRCRKRKKKEENERKLKIEKLEAEIAARETTLQARKEELVLMARKAWTAHVDADEETVNKHSEFAELIQMCKDL